MGIDIYAHWEGQTEAEKEAQCTGWSVVSGHVGYLREAYHGGPYATQVLLKECWDEHQPEDGVPFMASELLNRLPLTIAAALRREELVYKNGTPDDVMAEIIASYVNFVLLCARKEKETGQPCTIYASY